MNMASVMEDLPKVIKRDGSLEKIDFNKITIRIFRLCEGLDVKKLNLFEVIQKVVAGVCEGIRTRELDAIAAKTCAYYASNHPDYGLLAARIEASNLQKETRGSFSDIVEKLYNNFDKDGTHRPVVGQDFYDDVMENKERLDAAMDYTRDMDLTYFGLMTLQKAYLLKVNDRIVERPQDLFMRVAVALHARDVDAAIETYDSMSKRYFVHASPTLFNAGTLRRGYASCFLCSPESDSIEAMYKLAYECAIISKYSGGIGINLHDIRAKGSRIHSSNGTSEGIVPYMRVLNNLTRHVTQSSRRPASIAVYLSPDHMEILEFIDIRSPSVGSEETRARDLFNAVWIPDLFMQRVFENADWELFCPDEAKNLNDVYGDEYLALREKYVSEKRYRKIIPARTIFERIIKSQAETGMPYVSYKDAVNRCANQKHIGTICHSNLCNEITIKSSPDEIGVCNLASVGLPAYVTKNAETGAPEFDFILLSEKVKIMTRNLNKVIDRTDYPLDKARTSNLRHRPVGLGVSGLADTFFKMRMPFDSPEARELNRDIFETIYYAALSASCELAERDGPYPSYQGSEFSKGRFQFNLWDEHTKPLWDSAPHKEKELMGQWTPTRLSERWDWESLRRRVKLYGVRNSLLTACMPTASTSQILGYSECIEPIAANCLKRITLAGEYKIVNSYLMRDLYQLGLWTPALKNKMFDNEGSIQDIAEIPREIKELYKTCWEVKQRVLIDMSADRAPFIDQTQSLNIFMAKPMYGMLSTMHFYGWRKGLKTGMYYLRQKQSASALKVTVTSTNPPPALVMPAVSANDGKSVVGKPLRTIATADVKVEEDKGKQVDEDIIMACSTDGTCTSCSA